MHVRVAGMYTWRGEPSTIGLLTVDFQVHVEDMYTCMYAWRNEQSITGILAPGAQYYSFESVWFLSRKASLVAL